MLRISLRTAMEWSGIKEIYIDRFPFTVGRSREADYRVPFVFVSRYHTRFQIQGDRLMVQDLESHNGTLVNGLRISQPTAVRHGDEISMGPLRFRLTIHTVVPDTGVEFCILSTGQIPRPHRPGSTPPDGLHVMPA